MRNLMVVVLASLALVGASRCSHGVKLDRSALAAEMNDATVIMKATGMGCTVDTAVGYSYCRKREGDLTAKDFLTLHAPATKCLSKESCASLTVFYPDGTPNLGLIVPLGKTAVSVPWSQLTHSKEFMKAHRGFWGVVLRWRYLDLDGNEREAYAEGEIRMRVIGRAYLNLNELAEDPSFAWRWVDSNRRMRVSTSGRAYTDR